MTLNLIPIIHTKEEKKAANLRYKQNFIKRHFNGDEKQYKEFVSQKVKELYHDPTKDYKAVSDARRSKKYFERKEAKETITEN